MTDHAVKKTDDGDNQHVNAVDSIPGDFDALKDKVGDNPELAGQVEALRVKVDAVRALDPQQRVGANTPMPTTPAIADYSTNGGVVATDTNAAYPDEKPEASANV